MTKVRVQKLISEAGVASRRKAEEFIKSGQVSINGHKAKLGDMADPLLIDLWLGWITWRRGRVKFTEQPDA